MANVTLGTLILYPVVVVSGRLVVEVRRGGVGRLVVTITGIFLLPSVTGTKIVPSFNFLSSVISFSTWSIDTSVSTAVETTESAVGTVDVSLSWTPAVGGHAGTFRV